MGSGTYSTQARTARATNLGYFSKSADQIFEKRKLDNAMNPKGVSIRESRDSTEHPASVAIIVALDVTGSMGQVPHNLIKDGLPHIMQSIIDKGIADPQVLFLGIGDHIVDSAPLQVSQFESSDELLDKWLTDIYLEGGGGGNGGESYTLAWYFAANHTAIDCLEKRQEKGFLFTVGDEPFHDIIDRDTLKNIMCPGEYKNWNSDELLKAAQEKYNVYHINIKETANGSRSETVNKWKELLGENLLQAKRYSDVAEIISKIVVGDKTNTGAINVLDI